MGGEQVNCSDWLVAGRFNDGLASSDELDPFSSFHLEVANGDFIDGLLPYTIWDPYPGVSSILRVSWFSDSKCPSCRTLSTPWCVMST